MKILVREFTYEDLKCYGNARACDGNWSCDLAMTFIDFYRSIPKTIFKKKKDKYVKEHIDELFNLDEYPNLKIDIETGEYELL